MISLRFGALLILLFCVCTAWGQGENPGSVYIGNPGMAGMHSAGDPTSMNADQARFLYNVDMETLAKGQLRQCIPLSIFGTIDDNNYPLLGATGYYNPITGHKLIIGVRSNGTFIHTDTFKCNTEFGTVQTSLEVYADAHHDWTQSDHVLIHCDGKSPTNLFTTLALLPQAANRADTVGFMPRLIDLGMAGPGELIVGVVDSQAMDGELLGRYRYRQQFVGVHNSGDAYVAITGYPGPNSTVIHADGEQVRITGFEHHPHDSLKTVTVLQRQKVSINTTEDWELIDTLTYTADSIPAYIDSGQVIHFIDSAWIRVNSYQAAPLRIRERIYINGDSMTLTNQNWPDHSVARICDTIAARANAMANITATDNSTYVLLEVSAPLDSLKIQLEHWDNWYSQGWIPGGEHLDHLSYETDLAAGDATNPVPGAWYHLDSVDVLDTAGPAGFPMADSLYWVCYSYYDKVTGVESPTGPKLFTQLFYNAADTFLFQFKRSVVDVPPRASHVRVYQGVVRNTIAGAGDTSAIYGVLECGSNNHRIFSFGWGDTAVANGIDSADVAWQDDAPDTLLIDTIYSFEEMRDNWGDVILRPSSGNPTIYSLGVRFTDMAEIDDRYWGIGDPDHPNWLRYSEANSLSSWPPSYVLSIDASVDDELVAIFPIYGGAAKSAVLALKHNSIHLIASDLTGYGYDVTGGATYTSVNVAPEVGTLSKGVAIQYGSAVYFMTPDLDCYRAVGGVVDKEPISQPVKDQIDSIFIDRETAYEYCRALVMKDEVKWAHTNTGEIVSYNTTYGTWSVEKYKLLSPGYSYAYVTWPYGSFLYDTLLTSGFDQNSQKVYSGKAGGGAGANKLFYKNPTNTRDTTDGWAYRSALIGDGEYLYQISEVQMTMTAAGSAGGGFRIKVYDASGQVLATATDTVASGATDTLAYDDITIHISEHEGKWLSLGIESIDNENTMCDFIVHDIRIKTRKMGRVETR